MAERPAPGGDAALCPECQSDLTFVASWTFRDLWGYTEVHTYECATHGPLFNMPEASIPVGVRQVPRQSPDDGDRESLISARRKPTPTPDADAIALPEPDSD